MALLLTCGDGEERAEVYGCAADRQQATIVFDEAADMAQQKVRIRHQWPNGTRTTYDLKLLGYQIMSGSADGFMQLKVSGR